MILLDTNAAIYLHQGHRRAAPLRRFAGRLFLSPVSLLELEFLSETGRLRWTLGPESAYAETIWSIDDPSLDLVIREALSLAWTRDPFDRLLVAHALARGFRLATSDEQILAHLPAPRTLPL